MNNILSNNMLEKLTWYKIKLTGSESVWWVHWFGLSVTTAQTSSNIQYMTKLEVLQSLQYNGVNMAQYTESLKQPIPTNFNP